MTEYDAFGNPIDRGPPESAFGASEPAAATPAEPAAAEAFIPLPVGPTPATPSPVTPPPVQPGPRPTMPSSSSIRVSRGGSSSWVGLIIALVVFGLPIIGGIVVFNQVGDTVDAVRKGFDSFSTTDQTATGSNTDRSDSNVPDEPPTGVERGSMLRAADFSRALRQMRRAADGGSPIFVRVEAERVDLQVRRPNGSVTLLHRPWNQKVESIGGSTAGSTSTPTLRWSQIDAAAPHRIFDAIRNGSTRPSKQLTYAVMFATPESGTRRWSAFRKDGASFTAAPDGRDVQRNGG